MINNRLTAIEVHTEAHRCYVAAQNKGGRRSAIRFLNRLTGLGDLPEVGEVFEFQAVIGEGQKKSSFERMAGCIKDHFSCCVPYLNTMYSEGEVARSPKYGTVTAKFKLVRALTTGADIRAFMDDLYQLSEGFAHIEKNLEHYMAKEAA